MGVFFAQFVGTSVIHSADPVLRVQNLSRTTHIMEYMTADYKRLAATQTNFLAIFKDYVAYGNTTTKPAGYEGFPYYGSYQIVYNDYIKFVSGAEEMPETRSGQSEDAQGDDPRRRPGGHGPVYSIGMRENEA